MIEIQFTVSVLHYLLTFLFGVAFGSFLNVVVLRHYSGEHLGGRSHCPHCKKTLTWSELIPLFSYIFQLGRCKKCNNLISIQYPLVEMGMGLLLTTVVFKFLGPIGGMITVHELTLFKLFLHSIIWFLFLAITAYDFRTKLIPNVFSYTLAFFALLLVFIEDIMVFPSFWALASGPVLFIPFHFLWAVSGGAWIGLGDAKLALGIGWFLGLPLGGTAVLFGFWIGAVVSVGIIVFQKMLRYTVELTTGEELTMKSEVPFGPFLVLGTLIVYIFETNLFLDLMYIF